MAGWGRQIPDHRGHGRNRMEYQSQKTADQWFSANFAGALLLVFCFRRIDNPSKDLDDVVIYMLSGIIESTEYVRHPQYRLLTELKGWDQYGREKDKA